MTAMRFSPSGPNRLTRIRQRFLCRIGAAQTTLPGRSNREFPFGVSLTRRSIAPAPASSRQAKRKEQSAPPYPRGIPLPSSHRPPSSLPVFSRQTGLCRLYKHSSLYAQMGFPSSFLHVKQQKTLNRTITRKTAVSFKRQFIRLFSSERQRAIKNLIQRLPLCSSSAGPRDLLFR